MIPVKPNHKGQHAHAHRELDARVFRGQGLIIQGAGIKVSVNENGQYIIESTARNGGSGGIRWQNPRELDPTKAVPKDTLVYVSDGNALVTTGLTDLVSNLNTKAVAGIWLAAQSVPAKNGSGKYNVPQLPYPGATGTPSGTPLKGDLDGANVFWVFISQAPICAL